MNATGYRQLRKGRISIPGQAYLVTTISKDRKHLFAHWEIASATACCLVEKSLWRDSRLLSWVLMPDHLHALVQLGDTETLASLMQRVKAVTARTARLHSDQAGSIWMPGFHDRATRSDANLRQAARYLIANPLRAGLVDSIGAYPFWDAIWLIDRDRS
jgi:putative transposase